MTKTQETPALPTKFTLGGRTYKLVPFFKKGESYIDVSDGTLVWKAKELKANLGEEDGTFILKHQDEIPVELRRKIYLVFTDWRNPDYPRYVAYLRWRGRRWYRYWLFGDYVSYWRERARLVRRRPSTRA